MVRTVERTDELVQAVRDHAERNYARSGWDYVVECYSDEDIIEAIGKATSVEGALGKLAPILRLQHDQRVDIEGTEF